MKEIYIIVEGTTEEAFINQVLKPHFNKISIYLKAQQWITNNKTGNTGGGRSFDLIENHIQKIKNRHNNDKNVFISTMLDLYAFPKQGKTIFDNEVENLNKAKDKKHLLEQKFANRIDFYRFIPYIQLHEFETLLFADISKLTTFYTDKQKEINELIESINDTMPEDINGNVITSPSHRITNFINSYKKQKSTTAPFIASAIGLNLIRAKCPHFNNWITKLENI